MFPLVQMVGLMGKSLMALAQTEEEKKPELWKVRDVKSSKDIASYGIIHSGSTFTYVTQPLSAMAYVPPQSTASMPFLSVVRSACGQW